MKLTYFKEKLKTIKQNNGITLVALVVTIIVLLILAGVAIMTLLGDNGIINKTEKSKTQSETSGVQEEVELAIGALRIDKISKNVGGTLSDYIFNNQTDYKEAIGSNDVTIESGYITYKGIKFTIDSNGIIIAKEYVQGGTNTAGLSDTEIAALSTNGMSELTAGQINADSSLTNEQKAALTDKTKVKAVLSGNVPVPVGYDYKEGTSTALDTKPDGANWGVVITDENDNEWVWVPVNANESVDPSDAFEDISTNNTLGSLQVQRQNEMMLGILDKSKNDILKNQILDGLKIASLSGLNGLQIASSSSSSEEEETSISYTIEYYKDNELQDSYNETLNSGNEVYESDIETSKYSGYNYVGTTPQLPASINDGDTIKVYYEITEEEIARQEEEIARQEEEIARQEDETFARSTSVRSKSKGGILSGVNRGDPNDTSEYREPSFVTTYDLQEQYYTQAGFSSATQMAQAFKDDYEGMVESIKKYGGFYVGRYELSGANNGGSSHITNPKVQSGQAPMNKVNWYRLYQACRTFGDNTTTASSMIWGAQWDLVCKWTSEKGNKISYNSYQKNRHSDNDKATTGSNANDLRNNVYDLEGSVAEWNQEAYTTRYRASRGGSYSSWGYSTAASRGGLVPDVDSSSTMGSRPTLYIK